MEFLASEPTKKFADVWLPLALPKPLTYWVDSDEFLVPGMRIVVPLRGKKLYTGFVWKVHESGPEAYEPLPLLEVIDQEPYLSPKRMLFLEWMASYYLCTVGEVLLAAIPAAHRLSSESYIQLNPDFKWDQENPTSEEIWLFKTLEKEKKLSLSEISKALGPGKAWIRRIRKLQEEHKILSFDELVERYQPRTRIRLVLDENHRSDQALEVLFQKLESKPEEENVLLQFLSKTRFNPESQGRWGLLKEDFPLGDLSKKALQKLIRRGILHQEKEKIQPFAEVAYPEVNRPVLSPIQTNALNEIQEGFSLCKTVLLMGVTGSGKTEIYINLLSQFLESGQQCLMMLPEIAITVQIVSRLRVVFGETLGVYHSRASLPEKMEVWEGIQSGKLRLVIGVRSAVFLPFQNLGLIIADEEHDASYKQADPAPRYHGRDAAIFLAGLLNAKVLLGSATPSVESFHKARSGKWHWVSLTERYGNSTLPEIRFVDMKKAKRTLKMKLELADVVLEGFEKTKQEGHQSILFQNRRGYSPYIQCSDCGWIPYCPSCDVTLTLHQAKRSLNCHYCGHQAEIPGSCVSCGSVQLESVGYGTEKLEESLGLLLPGFRISRMDQDTTQSRKSFEQIIKRMAHKEIDILVGTQMVTKGLDFENVTFVSVFDIDRVLHYPDFRANERTFQLLSQIAGRAGRREFNGTVMVQTFKPYHPVFSMVANGESLLFYEQEVLHRKEFGYPPFSRLIRLTARHKDEVTARLAIEILGKDLTKKLGPELVLGPEAPSISRLRNLYLFQLLIKVPENLSVSFVKNLLWEDLRWIQSTPEFRSVQWIADVDPN